MPVAAVAVALPVLMKLRPRARPSVAAVTPADAAAVVAAVTPVAAAAVVAAATPADAAADAKTMRRSQRPA